MENRVFWTKQMKIQHYIVKLMGYSWNSSYKEIFSFKMHILEREKDWTN